MAADLHRLPLAAAARGLRRGDFGAAELTAAVRAEIARRDPRLNAYCWSSPPDGAEPGGAAPAGPPPPYRRAPLWGLPGALKANLCRRGEPTDCGSRILAGWRPPYDATVVERLVAGGAVLLGKTNMDEFGMGSSTEFSAHGPTRNPWDGSRVPGGSSGGAAAAVAAGLACWALGSDTGGSVRQPAHCCGVVGLKPTYGRISRRGLVAFASSLDQVGVLARDVEGAAAAYQAVAGHDPLDATSLDRPLGDPLGAAARGPLGLRVGVPRRALAEDLGEGLQPAVAADLEQTLAALAAAGVEVVEVELPSLRHAVAAYQVLSAAEAGSNLARYDGLLCGRRAAGAAAGAAATVRRSRGAGLGPEVRRRVLLGAFVLSAGYHDEYYGRARRARAAVAGDLDRALRCCDAVALPTAPTAAFPLGERLADPLRMYLADLLTVPASLAGLPAISVPTALDPDGLPLSVQLVGPALGEEVLLTLAAAVEAARGFRSATEGRP